MEPFEHPHEEKREAPNEVGGSANRNAAGAHHLSTPSAIADDESTTSVWQSQPSLSLTHSSPDSHNAISSSYSLSPRDGGSDVDLDSLTSQAAIFDGSEFEFVEPDPESPGSESAVRRLSEGAGGYASLLRRGEEQAALRQLRIAALHGLKGAGDMEADDSNDYNSPEWQQAGRNADEVDLAGPGAHGRVECTVTKPQKEGEGTQNAYISYLVTTEVRPPRDGAVGLVKRS